MRAKKTLIKDKFDLIKSVSTIVNDSAWFAFKHRQHGYTDTFTIHWYHDAQTLMRINLLASVTVKDVEGVLCYFIDSISFVSATETRPDYYTADRNFRPKDLKAAELLPLFLEFESRYNADHEDNPISFNFHERILRQLRD